MYSLPSIIIILLYKAVTNVEAILSCESDITCQKHYRSFRSSCDLESHKCTNPFQEGCLRAKFGNKEARRVCNSDDRTEEERKLCVTPNFEIYPEIRIYNGDRESSIVLAWIHQIILMELAQVPTTIGLRTNDTFLSSFYSAGNSIYHSSEESPKSVEEGLRLGNEQINCTSTNNPCVHFLPEVWPIEIQDKPGYYGSLHQEGVVDFSNPNGLIGKSGLYIPAITAKKYPSLAIWHGLSGESKREFLADIFNRPLSWLEYCTEISSNDCSVPDNTAARPPRSEEEGSKYFVDGIYTGYFGEAKNNDCSINPLKCRGYLIGPPCEAATPIESQMFWNNIVGLSMEGPLSPSGGFTSEQRRQIWYAANATKSHVIMHWFEPDPLPIEFFGTDYSFQMVEFPPPNNLCLKNRPSEKERCSKYLTERLGNNKHGSCMDDVQPLKSAIVKSIQTDTQKLARAYQSPAYEILRNLKISNLDIMTILGRTQNRHNNTYDPREAVCFWVAENIDKMRDTIPDGYPRKIIEGYRYNNWTLVFAQLIGGAVSSMALLAFFLVWKYRHTRTMVFAQPIFLLLILIGYYMNCIAAILFAVKPTQLVCTASIWLYMIGYTIEMVPVLVKEAAINKLIYSSKKHKPINLNRKTMLLKVAGVVVLISAYLIVWTYKDPPTTTKIQRLNNDNLDLIEVDLMCASKSRRWLITNIIYNAVILIPAALLAYQSRHMMAKLNESKNLATMVYSRFLFGCLRCFCYFIVWTESQVSSYHIVALLSCISSFDVLFAMAIYVLPKISEAINQPWTYRGQMLQKNRKKWTHDFSSQTFNRTDDLKILVCTGNMGNSEPITESMRRWIPSGGECHHVTSLENLEKDTLKSGKFDLVVIGMQEATWKEKSVKDESEIALGKSSINEEVIFNALEDMKEDTNTIQLRSMIADILGNDYTEVAEEQRGEMRLSIWAENAIVDAIVDIKISGANTGIGNVLANKGGIVMTMNYQNTRISFLSAHLAAHEGKSNFKSRCENMRLILKESNTSSLHECLDVATSSHHIFVLGDLNFRTRFHDEDCNSSGSLRLSNNSNRENVDRVMKMIEDKEYLRLYNFDELQSGIANGELLLDFRTLPCNFPPTFKVRRQSGISYQDHRIPSYTDRILFKSSEGLSDNLNVLSYEACTGFSTSDHKPVRGAFNITPIASMDGIGVDDCFITIEDMKCFDLSCNKNSIANPYLMFIWDTSNLTLHKGDTYSPPSQPSTMRRLSNLFQDASISTNEEWPRTRHLSKTLDPDWEDDKIVLNLKKCYINEGQRLFVTVFNHDAIGKDQFLGAAAISLKELITMSPLQRQKSMTINRILTRGGEAAGFVELEVRAAMKDTRLVRGIKKSLLSVFSKSSSALTSTRSIGQQSRKSSLDSRRNSLENAIRRSSLEHAIRRSSLEHERRRSLENGCRHSLENGTYY